MGLIKNKFAAKLQARRNWDNPQLELTLNLTNLYQSVDDLYRLTGGPEKDIDAHCLRNILTELRNDSGKCLDLLDTFLNKE